MGHIEHEEEATERQSFDGELEADCRKIACKLDALREHVDQLNVPVKTKKDLLYRLASVRQDIEANLPFLMTQFRESMDRTETEAKAAVEGFIVGAIHRAGLSHLQNYFPELPAVPALNGKAEE